MEPNYKVLERNKVKVKKPKLYKVIMYNDDFTTMEFVVEILMTLFNKSEQEANRIMLEVHQAGKGVAGIYPYDLAATKVGIGEALAKEAGFPFKLTLEEA